MNEQVLAYYTGMSRDKNLDEYSVKNNKSNDFSEYDSKFILTYADTKSEILDLGSGTGLTLNKLYNKVKKITAVELYPEFTNFIAKSDNIEIINENIMTYQPDRQYDLITFIGVLNCFNAEEASLLYRRYCPFLKKNGYLIVKNQFGVKEDITVSGYSEELKKNYFSNYRHLNKEITIIQSCGYKNATYFDIYPPECNRWDNTHFYAIVATK